MSVTIIKTPSGPVGAAFDRWFELRHSGRYAGKNVKKCKEQDDFDALVRGTLKGAHRAIGKNETMESATIRASLVEVVVCLQACQEQANQQNALASSDNVSVEPFPPILAGYLEEILLAEIFDSPDRITTRLHRPKGGNPRMFDIDQCKRTAVAYMDACSRRHILDPHAEDRIVQAYRLADADPIVQWRIGP